MPLIRPAGIALVSLAALMPPSAAALEYPIGTPKNVAGMEVAAVYLQPIEMEPEGMMAKASESDIHLEADIHALANNAHGFPEGFWISNLVVKYELTKQGGIVGRTLRNRRHGERRREREIAKRQATSRNRHQYPPLLPTPANVNSYSTSNGLNQGRTPVERSVWRPKGACLLALGGAMENLSLYRPGPLSLTLSP